MPLYHPDFLTQLKGLANCTFKKCQIPQIDHLETVLRPHLTEKWGEIAWNRLQERRQQIIQEDSTEAPTTNSPGSMLAS